ncbi:hypothetical protein SAMN02745116_02222 [Pilibacter termitis]|uniref:DUF2187 domain-containing protein n=1 Tax=Pilibacter termitis TaxID=263852 RepID=A0A1T4QK84_9ENTE|nr:hypothetical protein [Pilibacter termitis]SKA04047.1 hypothetical protein SAMN02745116_02222 [Pilibacter termitis]
MEITIGKKYTALPIGFRRKVTGTVLNVYENTVVLEVEEYEQDDKYLVVEKQHRVVALKNEMTEAKRKEMVA